VQGVSFRPLVEVEAELPQEELIEIDDALESPRFS
jgi:hypothetical protein